MGPIENSEHSKYLKHTLYIFSVIPYKCPNIFSKNLPLHENKNTCIFLIEHMFHVLLGKKEDSDKRS